MASIKGKGYLRPSSKLAFSNKPRSLERLKPTPQATKDSRKNKNIGGKIITFNWGKGEGIGFTGIGLVGRILVLQASERGGGERRSIAIGAAQRSGCTEKKNPKLRGEEKRGHGGGEIGAVEGTPRRR